MKKLLITTILLSLCLGAIPVYASDSENDLKKNMGITCESEEEWERLAYESKGGYDKVMSDLQLSKDLGIRDFWENADLESLEKYDNMKKGKMSRSSLSQDELEKINEAGRKYEALQEKVENYNNQNVKSQRGYSNSLTPTRVKNTCVLGDVFLFDNPGSTTQGLINHAGIYDGSAGTDYRSILSAGGEHDYVDWETWGFLSTYDTAIAYNVYKTTYNQAYNAVQRSVAEASPGEPYTVFTGKTITSSWYCSKIPWFGYRHTSPYVDIDNDGGVYVLPEDIYHSPETIRRYTFN